jgi:antitoxin component YwqK of YwqJK toxin-antitoxin module
MSKYQYLLDEIKRCDTESGSEGNGEMIYQVMEDYDNSGEAEDGLFQAYFTNGVLRYEWEYKNGKRNGISRSFNMDGSFKMERIWEDGKEIGRTWYWPNGNIREERKGSIWKMWSPDGTESTEYSWVGEGKMVRWYQTRDHQKEYEVTMRRGERHGKLTYWDINGQKIKEEIYKQGKLIS